MVFLATRVGTSIEGGCLKYMDCDSGVVRISKCTLQVPCGFDSEQEPRVRPLENIKYSLFIFSRTP